MITLVSWLLAGLGFVTAAFLAGRLRALQRASIDAATIGERAAAAERELAGATALLQQSQSDLTSSREECGRINEELTRAVAVNAGLSEKVSQAADNERRMKEDREDLRIRFENLANQIFDSKQEAAKDSLQKTLSPFKDQLEAFRRRIDEVHTAESQQGGELANQLKQLQQLNTELQAEAHSLARALRNEPQLRGRWGEVILERCLEIAGLEKDKHYRMQVSEDGSRMDAVVDLPGDRCIIIDSKVPLNSYADFSNALDEGTQRESEKLLVSAVRGFVDELARKDYAHLLSGKSPDFVIMLIPLEAAFAVALKADGLLMEYALSRKVIPTSSASLVATLRVIEKLWQIDSQNKNVLSIANEGTKLLDYIDKFVDELNHVGKALETAAESHRKAFRRITEGGQGSILRTAAKLDQLGIRPRGIRSERARTALAAVNLLTNEAEDIEEDDTNDQPVTPESDGPAPAAGGESGDGTVTPDQS